MGSCYSIEKCPKCGFHKPEEGKGCIYDFYTNGEYNISCMNPKCDYGIKGVLVPKCPRCGEVVISPELKDRWMTSGLKVCPNCNFPFLRWEIKEFKTKTRYLRIPSSELRPMAELINLLKKEKEP